MPAPTERLENIIGIVFDHIPEDTARLVVDGLSQARIDAGPRLASKLTHTPPEERTWKDMVVPAALSLTDKLDGIGPSLIGPTARSRS